MLSEALNSDTFKRINLIKNITEWENCFLKFMSLITVLVRAAKDFVDLTT